LKFITLYIFLFCSVYPAYGNSFYAQEPVFESRVYMQERGVGKAETIILIHGLGDAGMNDWSEVLPMLEKQYHVITFDLPGFGNSEKSNLLYSPTKYAYFIKWVVEKYAPVDKKVIMVGHSMGAAIGLRYASLYPESLKRLILVDAAGILHRSAFARSSVKSAVNFDGWFASLFHRQTKALGNWLGDVVIKTESLPVPVDKILKSKKLRATFLSGNPNTIAAAALLQEDFSSAVHHLQVPTQVIWGGEDNVAPLRTGRLLQAKLPATLTIIPTSGHTPMKDNSKVFNQVLLKNLKAQASIEHQVSFETSRKVGLCHKKDNMIFSGAYDTIELIDCKGVKLEGVSVRQLFITSSEVEIYDSIVKTKGVGIIVQSSRVTGTALEIEAEIAISTVSSQIDLAGCVIKSRQEAVVSSSARNSKVVFSVSKIYSNEITGYVHRAYDVDSSRPI